MFFPEKNDLVCIGAGRKHYSCGGFAGDMSESCFFSKERIKVACALIDTNR